MSTALKLRRGTTAQHSTFTGLEGELTVDTTKDTAVVHDGSTAGGFPLLRQDLTNNTDVAKFSSLATVATTGAYSDLSGTPTLGTAAAQDTTAFDAAGTAVALAIALG